MPRSAARTDPEGVDYGWVMQTTFVLTILVGAPLVAVLSAVTPLDTWAARASFAVRVGAAVWLVTAVVVFLYARRRGAGDGGDGAGGADRADRADGSDVDDGG